MKDYDSDEVSVFVFLIAAVLLVAIFFAGNASGTSSMRKDAVAANVAKWEVDGDGNVSFKWKEAGK